jgi:hypothetical protein
LQRIVTTHFGRVLQRFDAALRLALPDQSETDIAWNVHFSVGAMAHTLRGFPQIHCDMSNRHEVLDRLVAYTSAGFRTVRRRKEEPEHVRP